MGFFGAGFFAGGCGFFCGNTSLIAGPSDGLVGFLVAATRWTIGGGGGQKRHLLGCSLCR